MLDSDSDTGLGPHSRNAHSWPETYAARTSAFRKFASRYGQPLHVLYPGCGYDRSPSEVFLDVVYVDTNKFHIDLMRQDGLDAREADAHKFIPDRDFNLIISMEFGLTSDDFRRLLRSGHVICDYYQSVELSRNPDFDFVENLDHPERGFEERSLDYLLFRRR